MMKEILYPISVESCQGTGGDLVRLLQTQRLNGFIAGTWKAWYNRSELIQAY